MGIADYVYVKLSCVRDHTGCTFACFLYFRSFLGTLLPFSGRGLSQRGYPGQLVDIVACGAHALLKLYLSFTKIMDFPTAVVNLFVDYRDDAVLGHPLGNAHPSVWQSPDIITIGLLARQKLTHSPNNMLSLLFCKLCKSAFFIKTNCMDILSAGDRWFMMVLGGRWHSHTLCLRLKK